MRNPLFAGLFLLIILSSCNDKSQNYKLVEDYIFNVGFVPRNINTYLDKPSGEEMLYFSDPESKKTIKFFNLKGELQKEISLKPALDRLGSIDVITVISFDTIVINSNYTNKLVVINSNGQCWLFHDLNKLIKNKTENNYEYYGINISGQDRDKKNLYLECYFSYDGSDIEKNLVPKAEYEIFKYQYKKSMEAPYILKVENYLTENPTFSHHLYGFKKEFSNDTAYFFDRVNVKMNNSNFIFSTVFCPYLIEVNKELSKVNKLITISSFRDTIGIPPMFFSFKTYKNMYDKNLKNIQESSFINDFYVKEKQNGYYVLVYLPNNVKNEHINEKRDFLIIEYDNKYKKINEYIFDNGMFNGGYAFMTKKGLIISKNETKYDEKPAYSLISFTN